MNFISLVLDLCHWVHFTSSWTFAHWWLRTPQIPQHGQFPILTQFLVFQFIRVARWHHRVVINLFLQRHNLRLVFLLINCNGSNIYYLQLSVSQVFPKKWRPHDKCKELFKCHRTHRTFHSFESFPIKSKLTVLCFWNSCSDSSFSFLYCSSSSRNLEYIL